MMIGIVYSTDDIIRTLPYYYCILEDDYTLSFGNECGRSGGFYLKKDFFENDYEKEVAKQLIRFRKEDVVFYNKIIKMVQDYSGDYIGLYFSTIKR